MTEKISIYFKFLELRQNTESNRWMRFNTLILVNGLLIASWSQLFTQPSDVTLCMVEILLASFGAGLSLIWGGLSATTNAYHEAYESMAKKLEEELKTISGNWFGDFILENEGKFVNRQNILIGLGSTKFLTEVTPLIFVALFLILVVVSIVKNWPLFLWFCYSW